jgi:endonuclease YncB( thermonuclease family)
MDIDQGLNSHQHESLRLIDCYAPELAERGGMAARDFLASFVKVYNEFRVVTFPNRNRVERRSFTRYVAAVYFAPPFRDGTETLSHVMVSSGMASATCTSAPLDRP